MTEWIILGLLGSLICGALASYVAQQKQRDGFSWFVIGFLFGVLGLIAVAGIPKAEKVAAEGEEQFAPDREAREAAMARLLVRDGVAKNPEKAMDLIMNMTSDQWEALRRRMEEERNT